VHTSRILGLDVARALAVIGMVMVHVGPFEPDTSDLSGWAYRSTHGRASILFVLLAGIGISLLAARRDRAGTATRLGWRAVVFLPLGIALQALPTPVAVILHFYAVYYLLGAFVVALPTRWLAVLAAVWTAAGPIAFLAVSDPDLGARGTATAVGDPQQLVGDLLLTGYYPLLTWAPPLLIGMLIGRADLADRRIGATLLAGGAVVAAAAYGSSELARAALPDAGSSYVLAEGHTGAPLNVLGASGLAVAVVAVCLLVTPVLRRGVWPLAAVGQLALTVYVGHLLVLAVAPELLEGRGSVGEAWFQVGRFVLVTTVLCTAWRARADRGPLEALLAMPFNADDRQRRADGLMPGARAGVEGEG
jgi:uncharacterized membrane protein YeiB